jgi:hypothetical protein
VAHIWLLLTCALHLFTSDYSDPSGVQLELAYQGMPIYSMEINQTQVGTFISGAALLASQQQNRMTPDSRGSQNLNSQDTLRTPMQGDLENSPEQLVFLESSRRYSQVYMVFPFREGVTELMGLLETLREDGGATPGGETILDGASPEEPQEVTKPLDPYSNQILPPTIVDLTNVILQIPGDFSSSVATTNLPRTIRAVANGENIFISRTPMGYIVGAPSRGISITISLAE